MQQPHLLADQVTQQVESLGPVPVQRRARIAAALSYPSQGDPLPPVLQQHLTGRREHIATGPGDAGVDLRVGGHSRTLLSAL